MTLTFEHPDLQVVYQTILHTAHLSGWENCKEASVATLLGLQLADVPPFNSYDQWGAFDPLTTWRNMHRFFAERGLNILQLHGGLTPDCYYLAEGPTHPVAPGADHVGHMVVMRAGQLAHDPAGGRGLWRVDHIYVAVPTCLSDLRPHGWHPAYAGGLQLPHAVHVVPPPTPWTAPNAAVESAWTGAPVVDPWDALSDAELADVLEPIPPDVDWELDDVWLPDNTLEPARALPPF